MPDNDTEERDFTRLTHTQTVHRLRDVRDELERLKNKAETKGLTPEDEERWADHVREVENLNDHRKNLERQAEYERTRLMAEAVDGSSAITTVTGGGSGGQVRAVRGSDGAELDRDILDPDSVEDKRFKDPWDLSEVRTFNRSRGEVGQELRARAVSAIEQMPGLNDQRRAGATKIVERFDNEAGDISRMALATSAPAYVRAFAKAARGQEHTLTPEERDAVTRAMSLTDGEGGYLVPFQLDPTVIITSDGSFNQIRQIARQVVATGDVWNGVSAGETSWSWDDEAEEASDDSSTFVQPTVPIHKGTGFVPISIEALADEQNVSQEVGRLLAAGKETLEATAFAVGSGSGQPNGIVTALAGTASNITTATAATFASEDVYTTQNALPARYRAMASWLANNGIYNEIRQFASSDGPDLWERIGEDRPGLLLGRSAYEAEAMSADAATSAEHIAVFGDFSNYVIADRIGMTVEFVPHLFGANNRPTGQRGWYAYFRTGGDVVNIGGLRLLTVASP